MINATPSLVAVYPEVSINLETNSVSLLLTAYNREFSVKRFLRRIRGIIGTGLMWAVGWAAVNLGLGLITGWTLVAFVPILTSGLTTGFLAGGTFAIILSIVERRRTLEDLSLKRTAVWGGIGGIFFRAVFLPLMLPFGLPVSSLLLPFVFDGLTAAGFASGSVALARRSDNKLLEGEDDPLPALEGG